MRLFRGLYSLVSGLVGAVVGLVSGLLRAVVALVLSLLATLLLLISAVLCVTILLLPLGIPIGYLAMRHFAQSAKLLVPGSGLERRLRQSVDGLRSRGGRWRKKLAR